MPLGSVIRHAASHAVYISHHLQVYGDDEMNTAQSMCLPCFVSCRMLHMWLTCEFYALLFGGTSKLTMYDKHYFCIKGIIFLLIYYCASKEAEKLESSPARVLQAF